MHGTDKSAKRKGRKLCFVRCRRRLPLPWSRVDFPCSLSFACDPMFSVPFLGIDWFPCPFDVLDLVFSQSAREEGTVLDKSASLSVFLRNNG